MRLLADILSVFLLFGHHFCTAQGPPPAIRPPPLANLACSERSRASPSWEILNFTFDSDSRYSFDPGTAGRMQIGIRNTANGFTLNCLNGANLEFPAVADGFSYLEDGNVWYTCYTLCTDVWYRKEFEWNYPPLLKTSFHFDVEGEVLSVRQLWYCNDTVRNSNE